VARGEMKAELGIPNDDFSVRWTGQLVAPESGRFAFTVRADDGARLFLDGRAVVDEWGPRPRVFDKTVEVDLEKGKAYDLRLEYMDSVRDAEVRLSWKMPGAKDPFEEALEAARAADVVVFVGGLTADIEGEEMPIALPGFSGGDRTDIALPGAQDRLLRALKDTGKPVVLVLTTGSALGIEWAKQNLPAVLVAWYPGQEGGAAIADVLFGDVSPAGRLPVTFYKSAADLPPFTEYDMKGRTYRYFEGEPLYAFGHGLSYTRFEYSGMRVDRADAGAKDPITVSLTVKNTGPRDGDEVVQLYARALSPKRPMPRRALRGFERVPLKAGESKTVTFRIRPQDDFSYWDETRKAFAVEPGPYEVEIGASSADLRVRARVEVTPN
jgi:beta-glucosidase